MILLGSSSDDDVNQLEDIGLLLWNLMTVVNPSGGPSGLRKPPRATLLTPWDVSKSRIARLQLLCRKLGLGGLLFIPGVDGRSNWGSQIFLNYVFLGKTGRALEGELYVESEYDALEDSVILVTPTGFSIFYSREVSGIVDPVLAHLLGVKEYCATQAEMDDSDLFERRKIVSFLDMLSAGLPQTTPGQKPRLGVPLPLGFDDAKDLESWPLIQAYALDEMGRKGFFTAAYDVQDITPHLQALVYGADAAFVDYVVTDSIQTLRHHLGTTVSAVEGGDLTWSSRSVLSEEELSEPLAMLYEFGHVRDSPSVYAQAALRAPRVLLGTRTALVADREARPSKSSAVEGSFHLVVEGEDPSSGIRFVRTYFLCCNALPPAALREASLLPGQTPPAEEGTPNSASSQAARFHAAYEVLVRALRTLPQQRVGPWQLPSCLRDALGAGSWDHVSIVVEAADAAGQPLAPGCAVEQVCLVSVRLVAALGPQGSVAVGDTALYQPSGSPCYATLTKDGVVPYFRAWAGPGVEDFYAVRLARSLLDGHLSSALDLGLPVGTVFNHCTVLLPSDAYPIVDCQLRLFENGLAVLRTGRFPIILSFHADVKEIRLCEPVVGATQVAILQLVLSQPLAGALPFASSPASSLAVVLPQAGSSLSHTVLSQLPSWRLLVEQRHGITPMEGGQLLPELSSAYQAYLERSGHASMPGLRQLVGDLYDRELSSARADLQLPSPSTTSGNGQEAQVTVLLGLPGSGVLGVAKQVMRFVEADEGWACAPVVLPTTDPLGKGAQQQPPLAAVSDALGRALDRCPQRVLLAVVGRVSMLALCTHLLQRHGVGLAGATVVMSADRVVEAEAAGQAMAGTWLEGLWDQASEGWCTSMLLTDEASNSGSAADADVGRVRQRFRLVNRTATILQACRGCLEAEVLGELLRPGQFDALEGERRHMLGSTWRGLDPSRLCGPPVSAEEEGGGRSRVLSALDGSPLDASRLVRCLSELFPHATHHALAAELPLPHSEEEAKGAESLLLRKAAQAGRAKVESGRMLVESMEELEGEMKAWAAERRAVMQEGVVQSLHGVVRLSHSKQPVLVEASSRHITLTDSPLPSSSPSFFLEFSGHHLRPTTLQRLVVLSAPYQRKARPLRTRESLTPEEIAAVARKAEAANLPDGWWFDGHSYIDGFGARLYQRPDLEDMLAKHVAGLNERIRAENEQLGLGSEA